METEKTTPTKWKLEYWMNNKKFLRKFKSEDQARKYAKSLGVHISKYVVRPVKSKSKVAEQQTENVQTENVQE